MRADPGHAGKLSERDCAAAGLVDGHDARADSRWAKQGEAIFDVHGRGGRHHPYLTPEQEQELLGPFVQRAEAGGMLTVAEIQQAYHERTGKEVARLTIYRLLERHGWRKLVPRPRHPKADVAVQAAFKETSPRGTPRGLAPG